MRTASIDELAAAIRTRPRPIAMLAGAGISRSAGVTTGQDLLARLARARGEDPGIDPVEWFLATTGGFPDYFGMTQTEPGSDSLPRELYERPAPTPAQRAIAALVAAGWVGPIVTPNLDHLLERALDQAGLAVESVYRLEAMARLTAGEAAALEPGAAPVVIKVHGDYGDISVRHASPALHSYHPVIDDLLDRVFDRFDLLVCGWSASWDVPLSNAVCRAAAQRRIYWLQCGPPSGAARRIFAARRPSIATVASSDKGLAALAAILLAPDRPPP